jgi:hypothetical protein
VQIRIEAFVGVQRRSRRDELLGVVLGDASSATWTVDCDAIPSPNGLDLKDPYIPGPPGGRFILWFDAIPPLVIENAMKLGLLLGRLGLTDPKGNPVCAAVRPPVIEWSAAAAGFDA